MNIVRLEEVPVARHFDTQPLKATQGHSQTIKDTQQLKATQGH